VTSRCISTPLFNSAASGAATRPVETSAAPDHPGQAQKAQAAERVFGRAADTAATAQVVGEEPPVGEERQSSRQPAVAKPNAQKVVSLTINDDDCAQNPVVRPAPCRPSQPATLPESETATSEFPRCGVHKIGFSWGATPDKPHAAGPTTLLSIHQCLMSLPPQKRRISGCLLRAPHNQSPAQTHWRRRH
jgi:hypothetical protein